MVLCDEHSVGWATILIVCNPAPCLSDMDGETVSCGGPVEPVDFVLEISGAYHWEIVRSNGGEHIVTLRSQSLEGERIAQSSAEHCSHRSSSIFHPR